MFAIAYAVDLAHGHNPTGIIYEQRKMREHLIQCLENQSIEPFPRYQYTEPGRANYITSHLDATSKWSIQSRKSPKLPPPKTSSAIPTSNQFSLLSTTLPDQNAYEISLLEENDIDFQSKNISATDISSHIVDTPNIITAIAISPTPEYAPRTVKIAGDNNKEVEITTPSETTTSENNSTVQATNQQYAHHLKNACKIKGRPS